MEKLLTCAEVAKAIGVSRQSVAQWCREDKLPAKRFGKLWRIDPCVLDFGARKENDRC